MDTRNKVASDQNVEQKRPTVSRHLLFIRHGQYNVDGETDDKRSLTSLGDFHGCLYPHYVAIKPSQPFRFWINSLKNQLILIIFGTLHPRKF